MLTVISPAKRLNETPLTLPDGLAATEPAFAPEAKRLAGIARRLSLDDLRRLMDISEPLARLNRDRFKGFDAQPQKPAALMFDGDTYAGLEAATLDADAMRWAQGHLRILSGLYGLLRPLDAIRPYRLEMGSRLETPKGADLYAFWGRKIAQALNADAASAGVDTLINCASTEYFAAVDLRALKLRVVTPVFLEDRAGEAKIVSFWAKKARGAMARFVAENRLTNVADLQGFELGGYRFHPAQSDDARMIFIRPQQMAA